MLAGETTEIQFMRTQNYNLTSSTQHNREEKRRKEKKREEKRKKEKKREKVVISCEKKLF